MKSALLISSLCLGALWTSACSTPRNLAPDAAKYSPESTEKFVLLDPTALSDVDCTGLQERVLADGRLDVVANIRNRQSRMIPIQVNCVFRDEHGMDLHDQTPFSSVMLGENGTESVHFTASTPQARQYSVRVRQPRETR